MATDITSKSELMAMASKLDSKSKEVIDIMSSISSTMKSVNNYDGIDVALAAGTLSRNLTNLSTDFTNAALNVTNYATLINEFDTDDFDINVSPNGDVDNDTSSTQQDTNINKDQNSNANEVTSGVNTGVISGGETNTSSSNTGKYYGSNNSNGSINSNNANNTNTSNDSNSINTNTSNDSNVSSGTVINPFVSNDYTGKINASGPVKITEGDPDNPNIDITKYSNYLEKGFEVTTGNLCYELNDKDIELLCAIVAAESDKTYDDALAVITTILNRCETESWINSHGTDPIAQATAPNQFVVYQHGSYKKYMDGKAPETVITAVYDALAGVRNHRYLSFRSNGTTSYSDNMISNTGNRYK